MNKKILSFALLLVSTAFFFCCTADDSYDGKYCFAQMFVNGKQTNYLCTEIGEAVTEQWCLSNSTVNDSISMMNGTIVYSCRAFCYKKGEGTTPLCYELDAIVTASSCLSDTLDGGLGGQIVNVCPRD